MEQTQGHNISQQNSAADYTPERRDNASGVTARLKWFNGPKGFGFVNPEDREDIDAFLHITVLQQAGVQMLGEGAYLRCVIDYGEKGAHVCEVLEVLDEGNLPEDVVQSPADISENEENDTTYRLDGSVKWYKPEDGFGFIVPHDGLKDVFIHKTCLERHDVESLETGQRLEMVVRNVPKGREVVSFKLLGLNDCDGE